VTAASQRHSGRQRRRARVTRCAITMASVLATMAAIPSATAAGAAASETASASAFDAQGMWIWYVSRSHGGDIGRIIGRARRSGIGTVYVKAGDASRSWSQFSTSLVSALHAGGLRVCAWQFIYGDAPYKEANVGAAAVAKGADCLIIDAEGHYEGKYASADRYIRKLRARIGPDFPVSLAGFPYVDYHPAFPYSVFLGPGAAQFNQPQMYWKTIGTSVSNVYARTYLYNRVFKRPIYPIGQTYLAPSLRMIRRFRRFAINYGAGGVSWWSWQETAGREWGALARRVGDIGGFQPSTELPLLKRGSRGDLVVWAQEHLIAAGQTQLPVTGLFKGKTYNAVLAFQQQKGLLADGRIGTDTWRKLLDYTPVRVLWGSDVYTRGARPRGAVGLSMRARPGHRNAPLSATLPAHRNEIDPGQRP
jgi:Putative peptidoglycan binding domain